MDRRRTLGETTARTSRGAAGAALLAALALAPAGATGAAAQEEGETAPLVGDRPDFTESAVAVAPGRVQLEAGYTFTRAGAERVHDVGEGLVRVGLLRGIELRIGEHSFAVRDPVGGGADSGVRDARIGAKLALPDPDARAVPKAALLVGTTLPTGSEPFGARGVRPGGTLALEWEPADRLGLGVNAGYTREKEGGRRVDELSSSAALSWALSPSTGVFAEYFGLHRDVVPDQNFLSGGVTRLLGTDLQLDARAGVALDGPDPGYFVGAGFIVRR